MKKKAIILTLLMVGLSLSAQYKIIRMNTPFIKINGKKLHNGDVFEDPSSIEWTQDRQAIKILDLKSGTQKIIVAKEYLKSKASSINSFLHGTKQLSSREGESDNIVSLRTKMTGDFCLADTLSFVTSYPTNDNQFFYISYVYKNDEINKRIGNDDGVITITPDIYIIDGERYPSFDTTLSVYYVDGNKGQVTLITDSLRINVISGFD